jgi:hypothetical protein
LVGDWAVWGDPCEYEVLLCQAEEYLCNFSVRTSDVLYLYYLVIEFFASYTAEEKLTMTFMKNFSVD